MSIKAHRKNSFFSALAVVIIMAFLPVLALSHPGHKDISGEVFSDPSKITTMPEQWIKSPIKYATEAGNADVTVVLDQDIYHTLLPLAQKFAKEHNLKVSFKEGTCGIAAGMLAAKSVDIGGFCCPPGQEDRLPGIRYHTLGLVATAYFVNPGNPVDNVTLKQLRDIYRGKIQRWSELKTQTGKPGLDFKIKAISRLHCKLRPGHWRKLLDKDKEFGPGIYEVGSIPDMISQVAESRDAIGWEVLSMVDKYEKLAKVKPLKIDGYSPNDPKALADLKYPLYRTYTLSTWEGKGVENKNAQMLVDYLIKEFEKLDPSKFGFVPVSRLKKAGWKFYGDEVVAEPR
ncbi:MAG: hypothetical protein HQL08_09105 [Nitrospirae bacterium]|nr:hypothetical protein [Nitrospirota bacterium]